MTSQLQARATTDTHTGRTIANSHYRGDRQSQDLVALIDGLEHRLATQPVIEQSKGILIGHFGIDPETAFHVLRRWSSVTNLKVREISRLLVMTATANPPVDAGRASQELVSLITYLNNGQIPMPSDDR